MSGSIPSVGVRTLMRRVGRLPTRTVLLVVGVLFLLIGASLLTSGPLSWALLAVVVITDVVMIVAKCSELRRLRQWFR